MEEMREHMPSVNMAYYISIKTIEAVHSGLGLPLGRGVGGEGVRKEERERAQNSEEVESDESIGEDMEGAYS